MGYSEFGADGITRGLVGLVQDLGQHLIGKDPTAVERQDRQKLQRPPLLVPEPPPLRVGLQRDDHGETPYRDELFTMLPEIKDGHMKIPTGPGWGTELNEAAARKYAWTG